MPDDLHKLIGLVKALREVPPEDIWPPDRLERMQRRTASADSPMGHSEAADGPFNPTPDDDDETGQQRA